MTRRIGVRVIAALAVVLLAAACGAQPTERASAQPGQALRVTLGTKDFTEQFIFGELYRQALAAQGYQVTLRKNIGSTEIIDKSLTSGEIDGYPEYLGVAVTVVAHHTKAVPSAEETFNIAKQFYAERGEVLSEPTPFSNVDAIATTRFFAQQNGLRTLADLRKLQSFRLGARPEFATRLQGLEGLQQVYGLTNASFTPIAIGAQYRALDVGDVDAANVFTTDGELASGAYTILEDPENLFGFQHVALVIDKDALARLGGDRFMAVINKVNSLLTTDTMIAMNRAVAIGKQDEAVVAGRFLRENGLL
jgi:osmoprotectant transport system substrate-binding protein